MKYSLRELRVGYFDAEMPTRTVGLENPDPKVSKRGFRSEILVPKIRIPKYQIKVSARNPSGGANGRAKEVYMVINEDSSSAMSHCCLLHDA
jgi:hypothetical protein